MSVKVEELIQVINNFAPESIQEDWDNSGWQVNLRRTEANKILVVLEITNAIIDEAVENSADFILTHHPLIFGGINMVDNNNIPGKYISRLIKNDISVYSAHTNFDSSFGGMNDDLADRLGLYKIRRLHTHKDNGEQEILMGRIGEYESEKTLSEICDIVRESLDIDRQLLVVGDSNAKIKKVAVCSGAGSDLIPKLTGHCDLLITGDVKYHGGQIAGDNNLCVIEAGHYDTEKFFAVNIGEKLKSQIGGSVEIIESNINVEAFKLL